MEAALTGEQPDNRRKAKPIPGRIGEPFDASARGQQKWAPVLREAIKLAQIAYTYLRPARQNHGFARNPGGQPVPTWPGCARAGVRRSTLRAAPIWAARFVADLGRTPGTAFDRRLPERPNRQQRSPIGILKRALGDQTVSGTVAIGQRFDGK